jgi:RNA polymerase sigma factor (sigma-70 family)
MSNDPVVRIVDDDPEIRKSLEWLFASMRQNVESYTSAQDFLDRYDPRIPGCLVLDVRMPGMSGLELQERLREMNVEIPVIIVTGHGDVPMAVRAVKNGAVDFLEKPVSEQALLDCINRAIAEDAARRRSQAERIAVEERLRRLTPRELEVCKLVVAGMSSREIAAELGIEVKTVEAHRGKIMRKTQAKSVPQLILMLLPVLSDDFHAHSE